MDVAADDVVVEYPVASAVLVAAVATVVYGAIQLLLGGGVAPMETAVFVAVFTVVYVSGAGYLRRQADDGGADDAS